MRMALSTHKAQTLFLGVTLLFAGALCWLGWRLLLQDRALARQRRLEQVEAAADRISALMYRRLGELEEALADPDHSSIPKEAVLVSARRDRAAVLPPEGLLYHPVVPISAEPPASTFAAGEAIEFQKSDCAAAAEAFRPLTRSTEPAIRAAALVRLGRNLAKCGRVPEALRIFDDLAAMGETPVGGLPAELVALEAKCSLLEKLGRRSDLERGARFLHDQLVMSRWRLSRASYEFKMEEARSWLGEIPGTSRLVKKAALSAAAEVLWADWLREPGSKGRRLLTPDGYPVLVVWISGPDELTALLAPADIFGSALRVPEEFQARLIDLEGRIVMGPAELPLGGIRVERTPASTRFPWTLQVTAPDSGSAALAGRQWMLAGGFALLVSLLGAASWLAVRATSKELAVARMQADFVSAVSHEFRSPLSSICQIAELLNEDRLPSDEQRRRSFAILGQESARLKRLVEGLLDFARMEAGVARYSLEPLALGELVSAVVEEFQAQPAARGHNVQLSVSPGLPEIEADREALGRAVWNLLDNAVKYSPESTPVWVEVATDGGNLAIRVRDEGPGIPVAEQKQIFRKFVRGSQAKLRGVKGTGIGLAMVQHIVRKHGGEIRLRSELERGSNFTILLPVRRRL